MIAVRRLALSHFRSHRSTRLGFARAVTAVHGPNGSGKTNLLEALSLLSPGRGLRRAGADELARRPDGIGWRVAAEIAGDVPQEVELRAEPGQPRATLIDGKPAPQTALARHLRVLWLTPAMDRLWIEGPENRRRFLDRAALSFAPEHADGALAYERAMRDRNRLLRDHHDDARWFDALEAQMAREGAALTARRLHALDRLRLAQQDARTAFPAARLALAGSDDAPEAADEYQLLEALAASRGRDFAAGRTLVGPHRADLVASYAAKDAPARLCSTGEQKALLVSLVLANARALAGEAAGLVLLLDEVAAHLDADRRAALYAELRALPAQVVLTGTGPELFAELGDAATHLAVEERNGESRVLDAAPVPRDPQI